MSDEAMLDLDTVAALEAATREREQCCKDICYYCKYYSAEQLPDGAWVHDTDPATIVQCHAESIRERAWQQEQSK